MIKKDSRGFIVCGTMVVHVEHTADEHSSTHRYFMQVKGTDHEIYSVVSNDPIEIRTGDLVTLTVEGPETGANYARWKVL